MGQLIDLSARRRARASAPRRTRGILYVDLADPLCVVALDLIDRGWTDVRVRLADRRSLGLPPLGGADEVHARAAALGIRLELPDPFPGDIEPAVRVGSRAVARGRGREFAMAAARLAYHGGYDLWAPDLLAEAAGPAGLSWEATLAAMHDPRWSHHVHRTSRLLAARGARALPALRLGHELVCGDEPIRARLGAPRDRAS